MNIVFYAVPEPVAKTIAEHYGFNLYRSAEEFEASLDSVPSAPVAPASESPAPDAPVSEPVPDHGPVAADVADGQLVAPVIAEVPEVPDAEEILDPVSVLASSSELSDGTPLPGSSSSIRAEAGSRILLLPRLDSEERQSEFVEWMDRISDRVDAVVSGQSSTISTVYYASQPGKFFSVERRHSEDDCEDLCYELSRIIESLLGGGCAHEEI